MFSMKPQRGQLKTFGDILEFLSKPGVGISTVFQAAAHMVSKVSEALVALVSTVTS